MDIVVLLPLLLPPVAGGVAGFRGGGSLNDWLRIGALVGVSLTLASILVLVGFGGYVLLSGPDDRFLPDLLTFVPVMGVTWTMLIGLYAVSTATAGSVLGGYLGSRVA